MKKLFLALAALLNVFATTAYENSVSEKLLQLLEITNISHDGTLPSIVAQTQKHWLRGAGKERWEVADFDDEKKKKIIAIVTEMGMTKEEVPSLKQYDCCVILGAICARMEQRLDYAIQLWNKGVRFQKVVFLTGKRPLDPKIEPLTPTQKTESEAALNLWQQADLPPELRNLPLLFISVPMIPTDQGFRRPNTADTVEAWLEKDPNPGHCLAISNQPYCHYQYVVLRKLLNNSSLVETVGPEASPESLNAAVLLDTLARTLYFVY